MAITNLHTTDGVIFDSTLIPILSLPRVDPGLDLRAERPAGQVYRRFGTIVGARPAIEFSTQALSILSVAGVLGKDIGDLTAGFLMFAKAWAAAGTFQGASSHRKFAVTEGMIAPMRVSVDGSGDAVLSYGVYPMPDGANDPIIITDGQSLSGTFADTERYAIGPVEVAGVTIDQIQSINIEFGLSIVREASDAEINPSFIYVAAVEPSIRIVTTDLLAVENTGASPAAIDMAGESATHANTILYLRKRTQPTGFVADGTAQHVKFTGMGVATWREVFGGGDGNRGAAELTIQCHYDGTNAPLTVTTGSAIS